MIDLQQFCAGLDDRPHLRRPFTKGDYTYATDGRIMVRVPADAAPFDPCDRADIPVEPPFVKLAEATFAKVEHGTLPLLPGDKQEECDDCDGRGHEHECPNCECKCDSCGGSGEQTVRPKISTEIAGCTINLRYALMMLALPGVEVAQNGKKGDPLLFRFDVGVGVVMPIRGQYSEHVEIERAPVAA